MLSITSMFAAAFVLPAIILTMMPTAASKRPHHATIVLTLSPAGIAVALIKVARLASATASQKKMICTVSFPFGLNIKIDVMINEKAITPYNIKSG